jgi:kynureninase
VRFGFAALYNNHTDVLEAVRHLEDIMQHNTWQKPEFAMRGKVT